MSRRDFLLINTVTAVVYAGFGLAFLTLASFGVSSPLWPPAGVAFAVALRWRWKAAPGILFGSLLVNLVFAGGSEVGSISVASATIIGLGATLQAMVAAALVRRFVKDPWAPSSAQDILVFLLLAGPVASVINATIGTVTQVLTDVVTAERALLAWVIWWAGDSMGVIVFGPLTLMLLPGRQGLWHKWKWRVGLPSLAFTTVLMVAIIASMQSEKAELQSQRGYTVQNATGMLVNQLQREQEILQGIGNFVHASQSVSAEEFRVYTDGALSRNSSLQALSWDISLTPQELPGFIAARRRQPGGGTYTATQRGSDDNLRPVSPGRRQYVLVDYIEPLADNREALGYDIASNPARLATIERAQATGQISATPPIDLVQDDEGSTKGMLVLDPVYDAPGTPATVTQRLAQIRGFSVGVYQLDELLQSVFSPGPTSGNWNGLTITLLDVTDPAAPVVLARRGAMPTGPTSASVTGAPTTVMGRTWQLELTPVSGPLSAPPLGAAPYLLLMATVGLLALEAFLILLTARERQAAAEAAQRTHEANHDSLTGLLNRRGFLHRLEAICEDSSSPQSVLLFCDLDRFKGVNDAAGHLAGDQLLTAVGQELRVHVRGSDVVARLGGDEFAIVLLDCPMSKGLQIAAEICDGIHALRLPAPHDELSVSMSIGATSIGGEHSITPDEALRQSDSAAYRAKDSGKGGFEVYRL